MTLRRQILPVPCKKLLPSTASVKRCRRSPRVTIAPQIVQVAPKWLQNIVTRSPFFGPSFLMHFCHPSAHDWWPFGNFWFQLAPFCRISNDSPPPDSANTLLKSGCPPPQLPACKGVGSRPDATMAPKLDQMAPQPLEKHPPCSIFRGPQIDQLPDRQKASLWMTFKLFMDPRGVFFFYCFGDKTWHRFPNR